MASDGYGATLRHEGVPQTPRIWHISLHSSICYSNALEICATRRATINVPATRLGDGYSTREFDLGSEAEFLCKKSLFYGQVESYFAVYDSVVLAGPTPSPACWRVWAHRQVPAWRTTPSTRCACPCQYLDTAGTKRRVGRRTTGGARGATPPSRCARFCASSWRCQRRGLSPGASPALALQRPGTPFAPLSPQQSLQAPRR
jgi:hypothetical protein